MKNDSTIAGHAMLTAVWNVSLWYFPCNLFPKYPHFFSSLSSQYQFLFYFVLTEGSIRYRQKKASRKSKILFAFCGWLFFYLSVAIQTPILIPLTLHPGIASYFFSTNSALFSVVLSLPMKTSKAPFSLSTRSFSVRKRSSSSVILKMTSVSSPG